MHAVFLLFDFIKRFKVLWFAQVKANVQRGDETYVCLLELLHLCWRTSSLLACILAQISSQSFASKTFADLLNRRIKLCVCLSVSVQAWVHVSVANQSTSTRIYSPVKQRGPSASTLRSSFGPKGGRQFNEIPFPLLFLCSSSLTFDTTHFCSPAHINMCVFANECARSLSGCSSKRSIGFFQMLLILCVCACKIVCEWLNDCA